MMAGLTDALRAIAAPPQETPDATLARWRANRAPAPPPRDEMDNLSLYAPVAAAVVGSIGACAAIVVLAWAGWI
jgi:hypothetical protein